MDVATVLLLVAGLFSVQGFYQGSKPYNANAPGSVIFRLNLDQGIAYRGSNDGAGAPSDIFGFVQGLIGTFRGDIGVSSPGYSYFFSGAPGMVQCSHVSEVHPDPTDCGKYFTCSHGIPTSLSCAEGTLYSTSCNCCEWSANVQCTNQVIKGSVTGGVTGSLTGSIEGSIAGTVLLETKSQGKSRSANFGIHDLKYAISGQHSETAKALIRAAMNGESFTSAGILSSFASGSGGILSSLSEGSVSGTINGVIDGSFKDEDGNFESKTFNFDNLAFKSGGGSGAPGLKFELPISGGTDGLVDNDVVGEFGGALRKIADDLGIGTE